MIYHHLSAVSVLSLMLSVTTTAAVASVAAAPDARPPASDTASTDSAPPRQLPEAVNVTLKEPVDAGAGDTGAAAEADDSTASTVTTVEPAAMASPADGSSDDQQRRAKATVAVELAQPQTGGEDTQAPFVMLGTAVPPATSTRLAWAPSQSFEGIYSATPVLVVNGARPGPTLCLTAAVHGDELNGVETVRRVLYSLNPEKLRGTVIGVPIVNLQGFYRSSRYLSDRRDLNRYFPGDPDGSSAARVAHSFFHEVITHCSAVVDLHTGSFYRTNLPQLRGDLRHPQVVRLTESFGSTVVLHSEGAEGTLRRAAVEAGIPAVTLEAGAPMVLSEDSVSHSVKGVRTLLSHLDMINRFNLWGDPEPVYYNSTWQRAPEGGIVFSNVYLGQTVRKGDLLGTVTNPITNVRTEIRSSYDGRVVGMALNQVVQAGFATHHIGIKAPAGQISAPQDVPPIPAVTEPGDPDDAPAGEIPLIDAEDEDFDAGPEPIDMSEDSASLPAEE